MLRLLPFFFLISSLALFASDIDFTESKGYNALVSVFRLFAFDIDFTESKGTDQSVIASFSPTRGQNDVWNNIKIEVTFNVPIDTSSVQKNNIKLVHLSSKTNDYIDGTIEYDKYNNKVLYTPNALLEKGVYEVEIKSLKADKAYKSAQIKEIKYRFYVPEVIHGHQLPPEPDPVVNNSTLLGIDANGNGVRDDVEIWILNKYKDKHPVYIDIAMQAGRAWQKVLADPGKAQETSQVLHAAQDCQFYFQYGAKRIGEPILVHETIIDRSFRKKVTNTKEREDAYWEYDTRLSGSIGMLTGVYKEKEYCDFNKSKYKE